MENKINNIEKIDLRKSGNWGYLVNKLLNNKDITENNFKDWEILNKYFKELHTYFSVMQYELKIDEENGFGYIEEFEDMNYMSLSKKQQLSFGVTLLLVILREYLYKDKNRDIYGEDYVVKEDYIKENLIIYLKDKYENDEKKIFIEIKNIIKKTKDLGIIKEIGNQEYLINKIIKSKINVEEMGKILKNIKEELNI